MKAIQFKKTGAHSGNCGEVFTCLGGKIVYAGKSGSTGIQKTYERDNHTFPLQFNDWIVEMQGVIFVLSDLQYKTLSLELMNQPKEDIGNQIDLQWSKL